MKALFVAIALALGSLMALGPTHADARQYVTMQYGPYSGYYGYSYPYGYTYSYTYPYGYTYAYPYGYTYAYPYGAYYSYPAPAYGPYVGFNAWYGGGWRGGWHQRHWRR